MRVFESGGKNSAHNNHFPTEYETMLESLREQREKFEQMHTRLLKVRADKIEAKSKSRVALLPDLQYHG